MKQGLWVVLPMPMPMPGPMPMPVVLPCQAHNPSNSAPIYVGKHLKSTIEV